VIDDALALLDDALSGPAVVFGSLPPAGRDIDLLVRRAERDAAARALAAAGFERDGHRWVRFADWTACCVELEPAEEWRLPPAALNALFDEAFALEGRERVRRPSPHHQLLLLARQIEGGAELTPKRRQRALDAVAADGGAWERAGALVGDWGLSAALADLRAASASASEGAAPAHRRTVAGAGRRARHVLRPRIVAISGIDGSGKSTQASALRDALDRLGYDAEIAWAPLAHDALLEKLGPPLKRAARRLVGWRVRSRGTSPAAAPAESPSPSPGTDEPRPLPRLLKAPWITFVAASNVATHVRKVARYSAHGQVVIFDRYALDSAARLRFFFGEGRLHRVLNRLIVWLSPRPLCTFFLDLDPAASLARKDDGWSLAELETQARLYRDEIERLDAIRLDATRPGEELAAELAREVWRRLR
jgi:thymidylate kinase